MCVLLVKLVFEAAPVLQREVESAALVSMIARYIEAARRDAEQAEAERRLTLDRLLLAERRRLEASRAERTEDVVRSESAIRAARTRIDDAWRRHDRAQADVAFAEERAGRHAAGPCRRPAPLAGLALRAFAGERIRQLDEIAAGWGADRPERDRALLEELRRLFQALTTVDGTARAHAR